MPNLVKPTYFTVVGDFRAVVPHFQGDGTFDPALSPVTGTITFTPVVLQGDVLLAVNADPRPLGIVAAPISGIIDSDGRVKLYPEFAAPIDPAADPEQRVARDGGYEYEPVRLLADTPLLQLKSDLYYRVTFSGIKFRGRAGQINPFVFQAPKSDVELNLISVARQPGQPASGQTVVRPTGVRVDDDGNVVFQFNGVDIPDPLPLGGIGGGGGGVSTWASLAGKPLVIAAGGSEQAAADVIDAVRGSRPGLKVWTGTADEYEAIAVPDPDTVYLVVGDAGSGGSGGFNWGAVEPLDDVDEDTEILVFDKTGRAADKAVRVSTWRLFKARVDSWVQEFLLDKPKLGSPEITTIRVPDPGFNQADIDAGINPPRRNPGYFSVLDARDWLNPEGSPFSTTNKFAYSFRHDLLPDTDAQFIARTRKGGTQLITTNGIDTAAGTSHLVLAALRGNVYAATNGNANITTQTVPANQVVTAGNIVTLSNKTIQSPTITGTPTVGGEKLIGETRINTLIADALAALPTGGGGGGAGLTAEQEQLIQAVKFFCNKYPTTLATVPDANKVDYRLWVAINDFLTAELNRIKVVTETGVQALSNKTYNNASIAGRPTINGKPIWYESLTGVPQQSNDYGLPGWMVADDNYLYVYKGDGTTSHIWKRVPFDSEPW